MGVSRSGVELTMTSTDEGTKAKDVARAVAGDAHALQRLLAHYHPTLHGVVSAAADRSLQRHVDPNDVLQDACTTTFRKVPGMKFHGPGHLYKWLEAVAINKLRDHQKAARRRRKHLGSGLPCPGDRSASWEEFVPRVSPGGPAPYRKLTGAEAVAALVTSLARLKDEQRAVVQLRFMEGLRTAEIAERLGKTRSSINGLLTRGLKTLRASLGPISRYLSTT